VEDEIGKFGFEAIGFPEAFGAPGVVRRVGDFEKFAAVTITGGNEELVC